MSAQQTTHPEVQAARETVAAMIRDLASWQSYSGPKMASETALEQQLVGARKVLAAVEEAHGK